MHDSDGRNGRTERTGTCPTGQAARARRAPTRRNHGTDVTWPAAGPDEITVTAVGGRHLCFARKCRDLGKLADVIVIFGEIGSGHGDALWKQVWNTSQAMCTDCLNLALAVITARRPHVVVHDSRTPAPGGAQRGG